MQLLGCSRKCLPVQNSPAWFYGVLCVHTALLCSCQGFLGSYQGVFVHTILTTMMLGHCYMFAMVFYVFLGHCCVVAVVFYACLGCCYAVARVFWVVTRVCLSMQNLPHVRVLLCGYYDVLCILKVLLYSLPWCSVHTYGIAMQLLECFG